MKTSRQFKDIKLLYKVNNTIVQRNLLKPSEKILVAVSGGQDSICIIKIMHLLKIKWQWKLGIVHCDHRWHKNSQLQAKHVARLAVNMEIDYYQPVSIQCIQKESYARNWRYQMIQTIALQYNYNTIITAHNASDRIETLIYNLIRGTGLQGIQSLSWKRYLNNYPYTPWKYWINSNPILWKKVQYHKIEKKFYFTTTMSSLKMIRPMLDLTRTDLSFFLKNWRIPSWSDLSNQYLIIRRNRVRNRLLPYIRLYYNPCIDQALARLAEILYAENLYFDNITNTILSKIQMHTKTNTITIYSTALNIEVLRSLPIAFQRRVLKYFIYKNTQFNLSFRYVEHIRLFTLLHKYKNKSLMDHPCIYLPHRRKLLILNQIILYLY